MVTGGQFAAGGARGDSHHIGQPRPVELQGFVMVMTSDPGASQSIFTTSACSGSGFW
jgi:hypothetical protein